MAQAKDYALHNLPCAMTQLIAMITDRLMGYINVDKVVGLNAESIGYTRIVFYVSMPSKAMPNQQPNLMEIKEAIVAMRWWLKEHNFRTLHETIVDVYTYIWWTAPPVEIKEDRGH